MTMRMEPKRASQRILLFLLPVAILALAAAGMVAPAQSPARGTAAIAESAANLGTMIGPTNSAGEMMHLMVGRSFFVNTVTRLRRIYVSNPTVLDSYTASPNQIVITGKAAGVSTVVLWDEKGASQVYLLSVDVDVEGLCKALEAAFPQQDIRAEGREGRIVLVGTLPSTAAADNAVKIAGLYAKDVANSIQIVSPRIKQVRLKVRIIEVDRTKMEQFGFNFFGVGTTTFNTTTQQFPSTTVNNSASSATSTTSTNPLTASLLALSDPLNFLLFNNSLGVGATLKDLADRQVAQILAEPTIVTEDGEKASFLSGGEFPFPVVQGGAGGLTAITIQFRPYGVKLEFTPTVMGEGTIRLKVAPEVSALDYTNAVTISGFTIPAISTRRAETQVELRDGQTFAISGLLDHRTTNLYQNTPGIASVPILGELFKSKSINHSVVELMVLVTATIVDPVTEPLPPTEPKLPLPLLDSNRFDQKKGDAKPMAPPDSAVQK